MLTFARDRTNDDEDPAGQEITLGNETKKTFKDIADSIDAAGRQFAKNDTAI
jgi:hypothetical protein